ncbi:glycine/betaine ABC transporter substrate-binding protein [Antrihabitans sp. YC2-6]|nr:glycine/betaine ABC transporter substrate-binding protein [Antrihabitans sp. YC2-6]
MLAAACGVDDPVLDSGPAATKVVVGAADSVHSELVAEIYAHALARAGVATEVRQLDPRVSELAAIDAGQIQLGSETTGDLLVRLNPTAAQTKPDEVFTALNQALPQGISVTDYAAAQERDTVVATTETAERLGGADLEKIGSRCGELTLGTSRALTDKVVKALQDEYGCRFREVRNYGRADLAAGLTSGDIQVAIMPSSTTALFDGNLVALADDEYVFAAQNIVPVLRTGALPDAGIVKLNIVAAELTTSDLAELSAQVDAGKSAVDAARGWLDSLDL